MVSINRKNFNRYIRQFEFDQLFNQLGWNYVDNSFPKKAADQTFNFQQIAEKAGFAILICKPNSVGHIPDAQTRKRIHTEITKLHHEHLIIFVDERKSCQQWELLIREPNKPTRTISHKWINTQAPELLYQKLSGAFFSIEEDEKGELTIVDVVQRLRENFGANAEKVTKKFYTEFKNQHKSFMDFIEGIDDHIKSKENKNKQWYTSLMLNRLMFCYFIQKKGFLDQDKNYLKNKLAACSTLNGKGNFYNFYRNFLLELFHDGLGKPERERNIKCVIELGKIPYLNGGLFDVHELERQFDAIHIDDEAFKGIFDFFDKWEWHLDTRDHAAGNTINPDVIGYIFEKYINERAAMGAYYTKEDITDYIGKNTIIPFLFDETKRNYNNAFKSNGTLSGAEVWDMLKHSGATYIYEAVKKGIPTEGGLFDDLPHEVKAGFIPEMELEIVEEKTSPHLWELRQAWNQKAPEEIALPTEIYRELIERRKRYADLKQKIEKGEITEINDFITYNLNIRQFTQDLIETSEDAEFIRHFYKAIQKITILDPTCGSGAFLFAALNILEPLYETCIKRMEEFVEEAPGKHKFFEDTLADINSAHHHNLQYFIYKNIILNNLYGVDIMKEAVEIAKLRLFLKLVGTVDVDPKKDNFGLEPLPDIDFNIRAGNTLVGFTTEKELFETIVKKDALFAQDKLDFFNEESRLTAQLFERFQDTQLINDGGTGNFRKAKKALSEKLASLNENLNEYLATNYGIDKSLNRQIDIDVTNDDGKNEKKKVNQYLNWLETHQPFHWFAEFYQIVAGNGGFNCIIGNPPYVEYSSIRNNYSLQNLNTISCGNLYAMVIEQSIKLNSIKGCLGMILPISLTCTKRMEALQDLIIENFDLNLNSSFAERPSKLFSGAETLVTISINIRKSKENEKYSTNLIKWKSECRNTLFETLSYVKNNEKIRHYLLPKFISNLEISIVEKFFFNNNKLGKLHIINKTKPKLYYRYAGGRYWKVFTDFQPIFTSNGDKSVSHSERYLYFESKEIRNLSIISLSANLFYWYFVISTDGRNLNPFDLNEYPIPVSLPNEKDSLEIVNELMEDYKLNKKVKRKATKKSGEVEYEEIYPRRSKQFIDQIDTVLAQHYCFTEEELDFIINYDIKYRMGKTLFGEEDNDEEEE
ncbi:MAG: Eco57I restriction-modification methylase domain-containing protein [Bacteroidetes bacterium]|nr:Eco57I restriction-modification methylase domain-containing protein [Bacteroidota bacterium]